MKVRSVLRSYWLPAALVLLPWCLRAQSGRIIQPIDARVTVLLKGSLSPRIKSATDRGPVDAAHKIPSMTLMFRRTAAQDADLQRLLQEQQDPASPNFHKWLAPEEYADRFGISPGDMDKIANWLTSQNFAIVYKAKGRGFVLFSGNAGQVKTTFHTEIRYYSVGDETHYAAASEPSIPTALQSVVLGIRGMDDFTPRPADTINGVYHDLSPGDIGTIYSATLFNYGNNLFGPLAPYGVDGYGQTIVVVGQSLGPEIDTVSQDISFYRVLNHLPVPGTGSCGAQAYTPDYTYSSDPIDISEATLDLELVSAVAPSATICYVYSADAFNAAAYAIDQGFANVISMSYGKGEPCELAATPDFLRSLAQQANAFGTTWVSASGDSGPAGCDSHVMNPQASQGLAVWLPASIPEVTGVGGTAFNDGTGNCPSGLSYWNTTDDQLAPGASANCYIPEVAWNDTQSLATLAASGGGRSIYFSKPSWQAGPGVPNDNARDVPDVAFSASTSGPFGTFLGYYIWCQGNNWCGNPSGDNPPVNYGFYGGTSAAAPVFAGIVALVSEYLRDSEVLPSPGLGNINPYLYRLAQTVPSLFHDVTSGNNIVPCAPGSPDCNNGSLGFSASTGYDLVTGLGSVNAFALMTEWPTVLSAPAISGISPTSVVENSGAFRLTVNGSNFLPIDTIQWDGTSLPTVFVSSTQLTASVNTNLISAPGTAFIMVSEGVLTSASVPFTIASSTTSSIPSVASVTNAASGMTGAISPGEIITIEGTDLGPVTGVSSSIDPTTGVFDAALQGTTVTFSVVGPAIVQASGPILYTSANQVNAIVPYELTVGSEVVVRVAYQGQSSLPSITPIQVVGSAPGIFTLSATGVGQAAAINPDGTVNGPGNPAAAGSIIAIYATGEGLTNPAGVDGKPAGVALPLPAPLLPVSAEINKQSVPVLYAGGAPGEVAGLIQVNVQIPANAPSGNVPIVLVVGGVDSQGGITIAIQ